MTEPIRVFLADDHPLIRAGIRATLEAVPDVVVVGEAADGEKTQQRCRDLHADVLLLDLNMPGPRPTSTVAFLQEHCPETRVLVLTAYDGDAYVRGLLGAGVAGYVLKDEAPDALVDAVRSVAHGGTWFSRPVVAALTHRGLQVEPPSRVLTDREDELLGLLTRGLDNACIASELHLGEQTVRNYLSRLYRKLGVQTRTEAIIWVRDGGSPI